MLFKTTKEGKSRNIYLDSFKIQWSAPSASHFQGRIKEFFRKHFSFLDWYEEISLIGELSALRIDFMCRYKDQWGNVKFLAVEADGEHHTKMNKFFHKSEDDFIDSLNRDICKEHWCELNNIPLIRIYPEHEPLTLDWFNKKFNFPLPLA